MGLIPISVVEKEMEFVVIENRNNFSEIGDENFEMFSTSPRQGNQLYTQNNIKIWISECLFTGLQWVGWQWAVFLCEVTCHSCGIFEWRDVIVMSAITISEIVWCQFSGHIIDTHISGKQTESKVDKSEQIVSELTKDDKYLKMSLASVTSAVTFDFIDRAVYATCKKQSYGVALSWTYRCIGVMIADRVIFNLTVELFDRIKHDKWGKNKRQNGIMSIAAGTAAVTYNIGAAVGDLLCIHYGIKSKWLHMCAQSVFIFIGTSLAIPIGWIERIVWNWWYCSQ
jgi:hypothetical protein